MMKKSRNNDKLNKINLLNPNVECLSINEVTESNRIFI
jgi:hypothetical protein